MIWFPWRRPPHAGMAKPQTDRPAVVHGERANFIASGARSLQSRMTTLLAAGLMTSVGAGMLAWYYTEALSRPAPARTAAQASLPEVPGEGMTLPTFETVAAPRVPVLAASAQSVPSMSTISALLAHGTGQTSSAATPPLDPLLEPPLDRTPGGLAHVYDAHPLASPRQRALDRRLSGEVFTGERPVAAVPAGSMQAQMPADGPSGDALQTLLRPAVLSATHAQILPTQRLLLPKGAFIDCTLETAIDSSLPGMTTCITATDTFGADGTVVLLERGTKLIGETRGEVQQGEARVFVVWTEARTPSGVVVRLDSPGTDVLGRSGLDGDVNRHFWQRFGAAVLVSAIDGVVQSEVQSSSRSSTVVLDPTASEDVLNDILRDTVNIPPTIRVRNGARIQVLVARDVDFRPVYELEPR
jgi:type IV secretion system protein VirB10